MCREKHIIAWLEGTYFEVSKLISRVDEFKHRLLSFMLCSIQSTIDSSQGFLSACLQCIWHWPSAALRLRSTIGRLVIRTASHCLMWAA